MSKTIPEFTVDHLPKTVAALLSKAESDIYSALETQTESVISIGSSLIGVKSELDHGQYGDWIEAKFPFSIRTAQKYAAVFEKLGEHQALLQRFSTSTLYALADKKVDDIRSRIVDEIRNGVLSADDAVQARLSELMPARPQDEEKRALREATVEEGLALFATWNPKRLSKLIAVLRRISGRELADRLELRIALDGDDVASNAEKRQDERAEAAA